MRAKRLLQRTAKQRRCGRAAQEAVTRRATAVEQAAEAIVITDAEGTIQYVNPAFERITGYSREEALGRNPRILKSGEHDDAFFKAMWDTLSGGETWSGRIINKKKDGTLYSEEASISPVRDAAGKTVSYVAVKRDVTEEIKLEAQLRQAQKMEAVGQLAGGVAHDFNNILTSILVSAELVRRALAPELPADDPLLADLDQIKSSGKRAAILTRQLLTFSRRQIISPEVLDANQILTGLQKMLRRLIREDIDLRVVQAPDLWSLRADAGQIEQVIVNLVVNARDAMPESGTLGVETAHVDLDAAYAARHADARPGRHILLSVSDTGCGMDTQTLHRIFEPFFTTKPVGEGSGPGLTTVHGIVKQTGGHVEVCSEPGKGTRFKVYLPALTDSPRPAAGVAPVEAVQEGDETVFVCEDDPTARSLVCRALEEHGYTVLFSGDPNRLLELAEACSAPRARRPAPRRPSATPSSQRSTRTATSKTPRGRSGAKTPDGQRSSSIRRRATT